MSDTLTVETLTEFERRHPEWLGRLSTDEYSAIAYVQIAEIRPGDVIDIEELGITDESGARFLKVEGRRADDEGVYELIGKLPNGNALQVGSRFGNPMKRRRIVRYAEARSI